jgi:GNAT superfamily N-acetyltransferase
LSDPVVRVAGEGDIGALVALRHAWNEEQQGHAIDDPAFATAFAAWIVAESPTRTFFLVEVGGAAIGMANVKRYDRMPVAGRATGGRWGYVGNVFVLPEHRDGGVGAGLMAWIHEWARTEGLEHLRLAPSPRAHAFYERLGYTAGAVVELDPS